VIELGAEAARQVRDLRAFYESKGRTEAVRNLIAAVIRAAERIEHTPGIGLPAPRPYPALARDGLRWIKEGRYRIAYTMTVRPIIVAVFFEMADLPGRDGQA